MSDISITAVRIVNSHAEYAIEKNGQNRIWRRYRDFEGLRKSLLLDKGTRKLIPDLPPKQTWWASRSSDVVNQRKVALEAFLRRLDEDGLVANGEKKVAWEAFLDSSSNSSMMTTESATSTYLDVRDAPSETSLNPFEHDDFGSKGKEAGSFIDQDNLKRLAHDMQSVQATSTEDLSRLIRSLEVEREESKILKQKLQLLESEVSQLRTKSNSDSFVGETSRARGSSLPSLESDGEAETAVKLGAKPEVTNRSDAGATNPQRATMLNGDGVQKLSRTSNGSEASNSKSPSRASVRLMNGARASNSNSPSRHKPARGSDNISDKSKSSKVRIASPLEESKTPSPVEESSTATSVNPFDEDATPVKRLPTADVHLVSPLNPFANDPHAATPLRTQNRSAYVDGQSTASIVQVDSPSADSGLVAQQVSISAQSSLMAASYVSKTQQSFSQRTGRVPSVSVLDTSTARPPQIPAIRTTRPNSVKTPKDSVVVESVLSENGNASVVQVPVTPPSSDANARDLSAISPIEEAPARGIYSTPSTANFKSSSLLDTPSSIEGPPVGEVTRDTPPTVKSKESTYPVSEVPPYPFQSKPVSPEEVSVVRVPVTPPEHSSPSVIVETPRDEHRQIHSPAPTKRSSTMSRPTYSMLDESFLGHAINDDDPTPSILTDAMEELSDLSAIPIVDDPDEDPHYEVKSFEAFDDQAEELHQRRRTLAPPPKPPLAPPGRISLGGGQQAERRPPLVHSQTPIKVAQTERTPFQTAETSAAPEDSSFTREVLRSSINEAALVQAMLLKAGSNETVARYGSRSVAKLAGEAVETCQSLGRCGACEAVVISVRSYPDSPQVVLEGLGAMCNLAFDEWNARELRRLGAFRLVIDAMSTTGMVSSAVALAALSCALNFLVDKESTRKFARMGGAVAASQLVLAWGEINADVALEGSVLVRNLAEELAMARELGRLGACEGIMSVMATFGLTSRDHALESMLAMRNLSIEESNRSCILRLGNGKTGSNSARLFVKALEKYALTDYLYAIHGCLTLRNLTSKNEANTRMLEAAGASELITSIGFSWLKACQNSVNLSFSEEEELFYSICAAVWNFAFDPSATRSLMKHSVSKLLVEILKDPGTKSPKCAMIACGAVFRLVVTGGQNVRRDLLKQGIMSALRNACPNENIQAASEVLEQ